MQMTNTNERAQVADKADEQPVVHNSFGSLAQAFIPGYNPWGQTNELATPATFVFGASYVPLSINRPALSYGYMSYGVVQTIVNCLVDDAFKGGLKIESSMLQEEDIKFLQRRIRRCEDIEAIKQAKKWERLFGGAGLVIASEDDSRQPLRIDRIKQGSKLKFVPADRWEFTMNRVSTDARMIPGYLNYYGINMEPSRIIKMRGMPAPSLVRFQLQGWGMSVLEGCLRDINSYVKLQNVIYELVDEAKVDIYSLEGLNQLLTTEQGTQMVQSRVTIANLIKNYKNALLLDKEDEFQQKTMTFAGLSDILNEARIALAASSGIPLNRLFSETAAGLNASDESSQENYNYKVEAEVREPILNHVTAVVEMRCQQTFGFVPDDLTVSFFPLREESGQDEETRKTSEQARAMELFDRDLLTGQETFEILGKSKLVTIDTEVGSGSREPREKAGFADDAKFSGELEQKAEKKKVENAKRPQATDDQKRKYAALLADARRGRMSKAV